MKTTAVFAFAALAFSSLASAEGVQTLYGSTTIAGVITDAINQAGLSDKLSYQGGGSGAGEAALVKKQQGLAPMSRAFKAEALAAAKEAGVEVKDHVIALDGVGLFVHAGNKLDKLTFDDIKAIFTCQKTTWESLAGAGLSGTINVLVRDEASGTTDTIKSLVGISAFGSCVKVLAESDDIANVTNSDELAIGYAGLGAHRDNNRAVAVAKAANGPAVVPTVATIRSFSYPLARQLHVYAASGASKPSPAEQQLLDKLVDRSFLDPIVQDHDFITVD